MHCLSVKRLGRVLVVAGLTLTAAPAFAQTGPFAPLAGTWSGEGTITTSNGGGERIRCRARYTIAEGGRAFQQALTCASDSYKFEISSHVETDGTKVTDGHVVGGDARRFRQSLGTYQRAEHFGYG